MKRQTKFNATVVYVKKGSRLFPSGSHSQGQAPPPAQPKEKRHSISDMLKMLAAADKEIEKLILKVRLELEDLKSKRLACVNPIKDCVPLLPTALLDAATVCGTRIAQEEGETDEQQTATERLYDRSKVEKVSRRGQEEDLESLRREIEGC